MAERSSFLRMLAENAKNAKTTLRIGGVKIVLQGVPASGSAQALYELAASQEKPTILSGLSRLPTEQEIALWNAFEDAMSRLDLEQETLLEILEAELKEIGQHLARAKRGLATGVASREDERRGQIQELENRRQAKRQELLDRMGKIDTERIRFITDIGARLQPLFAKTK